MRDNRAEKKYAEAKAQTFYDATSKKFRVGLRAPGLRYSHGEYLC